MFDMSRGLLWRDGLHVPMTPKTADVLRVLIERRGEVVDKSDLLHFVWPNTVVEENNLARHISTLRKILQERRGQHDIISTIPGHGYMFVAPVTELHDEVESERSPREDELEIGSPGLLGLPGINAAFDAAAPEAAPLTVASSRGSGRWWLAAAAVGCVAAAGIAMLVSTRSSSFTHHVDVNVRQLTFEGQLQRDPAWSPDGSALVFATDRAGNLDLYRRSMSEPIPVRLTDDPADESQADWSPDGRWLAFRSEKDKGGVYVMPAHGGPARRISDGGFYPRWSPNGNRILLTDTTPVITRGFRIVGVDGQPLRALRPDVTSGFRSPSASWHPDGRRISIAGRQTDGSWTFVTVDIDGDGATTSAIPSDLLDRINDWTSSLGRFVWSRSGRDLYFAGRLDGAHSIWRVAVDEKTLAWTGSPERLYSGPGQYSDLTLSPDARRLAFTVSHERTRVWSFPFDPGTGTLTGAGQPLTPGGPAEYDVSAPLDGTKVAYRTIRGNRHELWERSVAGGGEHLLSASSDWMPTSPRWSRDGTRLAYLRRLSSKRPGVTPAVAIHTAGMPDRLLTLPVQSEVVPDDWSSDNAWLLAACRRSPNQPMGTCLMPVGTDGVADVRLVASDATRSLLCQRFSPDERWISFMALDYKQRDVSTIYVMPAAGGPWIQITDGKQYDDKPRWSPDGNAIYFLSTREGAINLWGQRFDKAQGRISGEPFRVTSFRGPQHALARDLGRVEIAVSSNNVFLPITETSGTIWMLDVANR